MEDRRGYDELYRVERDPLIRQATKLLGNAADAEAFVHDAFAEALESWDTVQHYARPGAWVRHVMVRKIIDEQRRERTRRSAEPELVIDLRPSAFESIDDLYTIELLSTLEPPNAQAVYLTTVLGFSSQEAAQLLNASPTAIRLRAMRGRQALQKHLGLAAKVLGVVPIPAGLGAQAQAVSAHLSGALGHSAGAATAATSAAMSASPAGTSAKAATPPSPHQSEPTNERDGRSSAALAALAATGAAAAAASLQPAGAAGSAATAGAVGGAGAGPSGVAATQLGPSSGTPAGTGAPGPATPANNRRRNVALAAFLTSAICLIAVVAIAADAAPRTAAAAPTTTQRSNQRDQSRGPSAPSSGRADGSGEGPATTTSPGSNDDGRSPNPASRPGTSTTVANSTGTGNGGASLAGTASGTAGGPAAELPTIPVSSTAQPGATTPPTTPTTVASTRLLAIAVTSSSGPLPGLPVIVRCDACDNTRVAASTDAAGIAQVTLSGATGGWPTAATVSVYPNAQTGAGPFGTIAVPVGGQETTAVAVSPGVPANAAIRWYSSLPVPTYLTDSIDTVVHGIVEASIGTSNHIQRTETACSSAPAFGMTVGSTDLVRCLGSPAQGVSFRSAGTILHVGSGSSIQVPSSPVLIAVEVTQGPLRVRSASGMITYADGTTSTPDGTVSEP